MVVVSEGGGHGISREGHGVKWAIRKAHLDRRECDQSAWGQQKTVSSVSLKVFPWGRRLVHFGTDRNVDTW